VVKRKVLSSGGYPQVGTHPARAFKLLLHRIVPPVEGKVGEGRNVAVVLLLLFGWRRGTVTGEIEQLESIPVARFEERHLGDKADIRDHRDGIGRGAEC
jgi:hypothetical protein